MDPRSPARGPGFPPPFPRPCTSAQGRWGGTAHRPAPHALRPGSCGLPQGWSGQCGQEFLWNKGKCWEDYGAFLPHHFICASGNLLRVYLHCILKLLLFYPTTPEQEGKCSFLTLTLLRAVTECPRSKAEDTSKAASSE